MSSSEATRPNTSPERRDYGSPVGPLEFLKEAFRACCGDSMVIGGGFWVLMPDQSLVLLMQDGPTESTGAEATPPSSLDDHLARLFEVAHVGDIPDRFHVLQERHSTVEIPFWANDRVKAAYILWLKDSPDDAQQASWAEWTEGLQRTFDDLVESTRIERGQQMRDRFVRLAPGEQVQSTDDLKNPPSESSGPPEPREPGATRRNTPPFSSNVSLQHQSTYATTTKRVSEVCNLAKELGASLDQDRAAHAVASELSQWFGCGRIGVLINRSGRPRLHALSGVETFDKRSAVVQSLESLGEYVARTGTEVWHPSDLDRHPATVMKDLESYYEATDGRSIALLPLPAPPRDAQDEDDLRDLLTDGDNSTPPVGVLSIEGLNSTIEPDLIREPLLDLLPLAGNAIANARSHSGSWLGPILRWSKRLEILCQRRQRTKIYVAAGICVLTMLALAFFPVRLQLPVRGQIQPSHRQHVYCQVTGTVDSVLVQQGDLVKRGDPLAILRNDSLESELQRLRSEYDRTRQSLASIRNQLNSAGAADSSTGLQLRQERAGLDRSLRSLSAQLQILESKHERLTVRSPTDGQVMTWDLHSRLQGRTVDSGMHLLTVADHEGEWEVEVFVPDRLIGRLLEPSDGSSIAQRRQVDVSIASHPHEVISATLQDVGLATTLHERFGNSLRATALIPQNEIAQLHPLKAGTQVDAKICVGQTVLGHQLFYQFSDWIRLQCFRFL